MDFNKHRTHQTRRMKVAVCLLLLVLVVSLEASPLSSKSQSRSKRGFRLGAADRFSHGFGKRTQENSLVAEDEDDEPLMSAAELADMLRERPLLINSFVRKYVDINGDGVISRAELFAELR